MPRDGATRSQNDPLAFMAEGGETGTLMRAHDWAKSPLGPPEAWPPALQTLVGVMLGSRQPMFVVWGPERAMLYNDGYSAMLGRKHPAALGRPFFEIWSEITEVVEPIMDRAYAGEPTHMDNLPLVLERNGYPEETHFAFSYTPVPDLDGRIAGMFCTCTETTEQVLAQRQLAEEQARLRAERDRSRSVLDSMREGFILLDPEFRILEINAEGLRIDGRPETEIVGRHLLEVWPEAEHLPTWPAYRRALADHEPVEFVYRHVSDVHDLWLETRAYPARGGLAVFYRDVTDRWRAETSARENAERLRIVQAAGGIGSFDWDLASGTIHRSPEYLRLQGLPEDLPLDAVDAGVWLQRVHPDDRERVLAAFETSLAGGGSFELEYRIIQQSTGETIWLLNRGRVDTDEAGRPLRLLSAQSDVTARKQAEAALRESEERLRVAQDAAEIGAFDWDLRTGRAELSERYLSIFGFSSPQEVSRRTLAQRVHPDDRERFKAELKAAAEGSGLVVSEVRIVLPDGAVRWVQSNARTLYDADGVAVRRAGVMQDITERRLAEEALRASEQRFRAAVEAVQGVLWTNNARGEMEGEQPGWAALTGQSREAYQGYGWTAAVHPEDAQPTVEAWNAAVAQCRTFVFEHRVRCADGLYSPFSIRAIPVIRPDGGVGQWVGIHTDISAERAAEAAIRESEANYRYAAELNPQVAWTATPDGQLDRVAERWRQWTGLSGLGETWGQSIHPDDLGPSVEAWTRAVTTGEPYDIEHRARLTTGDYRWMQSRAYPRRDGEGRIVKWYGSTEDIHERRLTANSLRELNETLELRVEVRTKALQLAEEQLRQSQKMEAVGQLTGGIAHDFNNLLQGITGSLDLVKKRIAQGRTGDLDRLINGATTSATRAAALTHRLLAFSRRQPLDPKPVRANGLVASMEDLLRRTLGERVELELVLAGGLWTTLCDSNQLENAILNLAINARDAMPEGGKLTIETCNAHLDSAYAASQRDVAPGQYVCVCVTDTGTGMPPEVAERAFDPFFTTKPTGQGTGLGLSMIYGFARQSEGYAKIYSEVGQGTTVKLYLPRHRGAAEVDESIPQLGAHHAAEAGETVLVVEDETVVRNLIVEVLGDLGYRAIEAVDGPSGLTILRSKQRIDLLVTDIGLPGLNGRQVADAARIERPGLKVLFMTGYAENAAMANGFLEPGMAMITKPFAMEQLVTRIRDIVEGG